MRGVQTTPALPTRTQEVYGRLREAIVSGDLRPNERLIEAELAERLQVSRTPVRECLPRLAAEDLIVKHGHGWAVLEHSADQIREIYDVRAALEGYATRLAAVRGSEAQLGDIVALSTDPEEMARLPRARVVLANEEFHDAIIVAAGNGRLAQTIQQTRAYYFNHRIAAVYTTDEIIEALSAHRWIAEAVARRDADLAEHLARTHVDEALALALQKV